MKKIIFLLITLFFLSFQNVEALDWDILNDDCADFTGWTNYDNTPCVTSQVTFDSKSCFKFYMPQSATSGNTEIGCGTDICDLPITFTLECRWYFSACSQSHLFGFSARVNEASPRDNYEVYFFTGYPGYYGQLKIKLTDTPTYLTARLGDVGELEDGWHTLRLVVKTDRKIDIWVDNRPILANQAITTTSAVATGLNFYNYNDNIALQQVYLDWIRADTTPEAPTTVSPLKIGTENIAIAPYNIDSSGWKDPSNLRIYGTALEGGGNEVAEIPLVSTSDTNASKVRIYSGGAVKSLMKLPD